MKNTSKALYIAIVQTKDEKHFASVQKTYENYNLYSFLNSFKNVSSANIYPRKECYEIVNLWNESYKNNGSLMDPETLVSEC